MTDDELRAYQGRNLEAAYRRIASLDMAIEAALRHMEAGGISDDSASIELRAARDVLRSTRQG